jgi:dimethylglycine dehydrogenase
MAKGARQRGADIVRKAQVDGYEWAGSEWIVRGSRMVERGGNLVPGEERFEIRAEHVVTATGNHAQRTARLLGLKIPAIPVEHQYIVTEPDPALVAFRRGHPEQPVLRDADAKWYVREERGGWILGPYERGAPARFEYGVPDSFRADLFPLDLERIEQEYMSMIHRIPSSEQVGLKDDFNGPICYTPDGNPLLGPAPGLRNMWLAEGFSVGITAAGGTGHYLAQLMTQGGPRSTWARSIPGASGRGRPPNTPRARTRNAIPTSSCCTTPTRSARPAGRCEPRPATTG